MPAPHASKVYPHFNVVTAMHTQQAYPFPAVSKKSGSKVKHDTEFVVGKVKEKKEQELYAPAKETPAAPTKSKPAAKREYLASLYPLSQTMMVCSSHRPNNICRSMVAAKTFILINVFLFMPSFSCCLSKDRFFF